MTPKQIGQLILAGILFAAGFFLSDWLNSREYREPTYRAEVKHKDGSVEVKREPHAKPSLPKPRGPKGTKPIATVEVTVKGPEPERVKDTYEPAKQCLASTDFECPAVKLRLDIVEEDGEQVVLAKANGEILDSVHIPQTLVNMARNKRVTLVAGKDAKIVTYTQDVGRWSYGLSGWEIEGKKGAGLAASMAFR